jgi:pre-mRNA-processing factor 6
LRQAGKLSTARSLIQQGVERCPTSEDVWLECSRLQTPENAKAVLARGVAALPNSVKLWVQASRLEADDAARARVLRKALERIPTSVRLWKVDSTPFCLLIGLITSVTLNSKSGRRCLKMFVC